ncbi:MAG: hypothetical protein TEF_13420 [Rhizobiales bacterium NRL2]|nr:MAG: hypothetical protein TEF_13420 [Rhizobiales bacterium NRL2]
MSMATADERTTSQGPRGDETDRLDFLQAIVETTDAIVVAADADGRVIWVNDAFTRITGFRGSEARGRFLWSFRVPEEQKPGREAFLEAVGRTDERRFESRWLTRDGSELCLSWSTRTLFDENGAVRFRVGTAVDVTAERRNAARALDLGEMLDQVGEAVILVDRDSVIQYANREAVELYRTPLKKLIGKSNRDFIPEAEAERFEKFQQTLRDSMEPQAIETTRVRGDGTTVPVELRVSPIRDSAGKLSGFVSVSYDISDQIRLQESARIAADRNAVLVRLLENLPDPVFHMRPDGTLGYVNDAVEDVYGYKPEELLDGPMARVRPLDRAKHMAEFVARAIETGEPCIMETQALHKDGHRIEVEVRAVRIDDTDGNYAGLAGFARDIGERKRMETELRRHASTDTLTGLANRRHFEAIAAAEVKRAARYGHPLSFIICDLDHFKRVNDSFGHDGGDVALQRFAQIVSASLRLPTDVAARLGGEEFGVLLPETDIESAVAVAERIRRRTEEAAIEFGGRPMRLTVSLGVSQHAPGESSLAAAMKRADRALYEAKGAGRNRTCTASA